MSAAKDQVLEMLSYPCSVIAECLFSKIQLIAACKWPESVVELLPSVALDGGNYTKKFRLRLSSGSVIDFTVSAKAPRVPPHAIAPAHTHAGTKKGWKGLQKKERKKRTPRIYFHLVPDEPPKKKGWSPVIYTPGFETNRRRH